MALKAIALALALLALACAFAVGWQVPAAGYGNTSQALAPAITTDGTGVLVPFSVTLKPGTGKVLLNVNNAVFSDDADESVLIARIQAEKFLGQRLDMYDLEFDTLGPPRSISGESATALISALIVSAYTGRPMLPQGEASATINSDGTLGVVEGIDEKMIAASQGGKTFFVVAYSQQVPNEPQMEKLIKIVRAKTDAQAISYLLGLTPIPT